MKAFKVIGNIVFVLLVAVAIMIVVFFNYLKKNNKFPQTITTTYVNTVTDQHGEEQPFLQLNYCANTNGIGKSMYEMRFTYYTDVHKSAVKSWGVQEVAGQKYYYDSFDGTSWVSVQNLEWGDPMVIDIDGELYSVTLGGTYKETVSKGITLSSFVNGVWTFYEDLLTGKEIKGESYVEAWEEVTKNYTFDDVLNAFKGTITKSSKGYGNYILPLVNLSGYFDIKRYDPEKTRFVDLDYTNYNFNYFGIEVSTTGSGVLYAKQSVFDMVANNFEYNESGIIEGDFWQNAIIHTVTNNDFDFIFDEAKNGYYLTLSPSKIIELNSYQQFKTNVKINIPNGKIGDKKILGLADYALFGLKINELQIIGGSNQIFEIKSRALWDTGLKSLVKTEIELLLAENAYNGGAL